MFVLANLGNRRKPGDVQVLRSANREKPFLRWQPEVFPILRRFLSTYVYYIMHYSLQHCLHTDIHMECASQVCAFIFLSAALAAADLAALCELASSLTCMPRSTTVSVHLARPPFFLEL